MSDYTKELAKEVLSWYNIDFTECKSSITLFFFDVKKMDIEEKVFLSWEDVLCEMLPTMEESNKDTFEEIGEHIWSDKEIMYVKRLAKQAVPMIDKPFLATLRKLFGGERQ